MSVVGTTTLTSFRNRMLQRLRNPNPKTYQEMAELGAISFEKPGLVDHLRDGSQPRKFTVLLPALDCDGSPVAHKVDPYDADSDMVRIKNGQPRRRASLD